MFGTLGFYRKEIQNLGLWFWLDFKMATHRAKSLPKGELVRLRAPGVEVLCRAGTSDLEVFRQIFVNREFRCLDDLVEPSVIIDCGANVGYATAYFASRFPRARIISVEPGAGNFSMLAANMLKYRDRCKLIHSGVWSKVHGLLMGENFDGDPREWAYTVREASPGETPTMMAVDIPSLIEMSGAERISVLKIDIEGAEKELFANNCNWLSQVDNLVIELHGPECERVFHSALKDRGFLISQCDELTVCRRPVIS